MGTISVGQATREKSRATLGFGGAWTRIGDRAWAWAAHPSRWVLAAEGLLAGVCYVLSVLLVAPDRGSAWTVEALRSTLGIAVAIPLIFSVAMRLHRRSLRFAGAIDLLSVAKVTWLSGVVLTVAISWEFPRQDIPAAAFVLNAALLQIAWGALHFAPRAVHVRRAAKRVTGKRAVIVGAGDAGMTVLKELAHDASSPSRPVALVDDDPSKWGRTCCGVPVAGSTKELTRIAAAHAAEEILICIPSATHQQMHDILDVSRRSNLPVRSLPSLAELIRGTNRGLISHHDLRNPRIEDLLQREPVSIDPIQARKVVGGKTVLVTGAGGSIGSELCRQIAGAGPRRLLVLDKAENSLFYLHRELTERLDAAALRPFLVDVTDRDRITHILRAERPEIVLHAAAYKHVAMLERHPEEAIRNNVLGTRNVAEAAIECGTSRFVNISTDKAVAPRNYMGLSKRITELCVRELSRAPGTKLSSVRFGNVAGTTGSVLRLFWEQIQRGGPVRITDPRATRYFMSVSEAVHLILRAAALGAGGETFVFDMGAPLNITDLARTMMLFAGLTPEVDLAIEYIGLQRGEKLAEELWESWEQPERTQSERILAIQTQDWRSRGILTRIRRMEEFLSRGENGPLLEYVHRSFPDFGASRLAAGNSALVPAPPPTPTADLISTDLPGAA